MRWSLRRGSRDADGRAGDAPSAPVSAAPAAADRAADAGWRALPPMAPTVPAQSPLTAAPLVPAAPLTGAAPRRAAARPLGPAASEAPDPGRVVGLASVRPAPLAPLVPAAPPAPYPLERPPLRHAPARPLVEHAPLTEASGAFVGEPTAPATPAPAAAPAAAPSPVFGAPRAIPADPPVEAATEAGARFREALANLHRSGLPRYESPSEPGARPPEAPAPSAPPAASPPPPAPAPDAPRLTHRRNTLAQSRRLGLGAPMRRDGEGDADAEEGDRGAGSASAPALEAPTPPQPAPAAAEPMPPEPGPAGPAPEAGPARPSSVRPAQLVEPPPPVPARPLDGGARPATVAAPLIFRARAVRPAPAVPRAPEKAVVTRAPAELAQALRASHGVDVGDVPVHRDPAAGNEARERRARAFSRGGRVYLPEEAGPLHSASARGLLAHELVHVAQQRRLGSSLPAEDTAEGRALEAEAQDAERMYATDTFAETPLVHAPPPVSAGWVEERITQHALDLPMPAQYPSITNSINPGLLDEVRYTAQKIVTDAVDDGSLSGSGGGTGSGNQSAPLGIGIGNAQNLAEFQAQTLAALNAQRREAHEREYTSLADLSEEERARIEARYNELYAQNRDAIVASQMEFAVQQLAAQQHENLTWTPQGGFQRGGAPQSTPSTSGPGNTPGPQSTPSGTTAAPTTASTTPTGATPPATRPPTPPTPPLPERVDEGYDIGVGHAHSEQEFREQILLALNMHRPPDKQLTWSQLSAGDQARVNARWQELTAAQEQQAEARRFQSALQRQAQRRAAQTTATRPASTTPAEAAAAGAVIGAQTADARSAAEHTNDPETDSGVTNTTAAGHPAISVDRIDMDDLTVRLWERLRSRLRMELLVDRERAGLLTDFR